MNLAAYFLKIFGTKKLFSPYKALLMWCNLWCNLRDREMCRCGEKCGALCSDNGGRVLNLLLPAVKEIGSCRFETTQMMTIR